MAVLLPSGEVTVLGGFSSKGGALLASTELFDPLTSSWRSGPEMVSPRAFHVATALADGTVLVTGGQDSVEGQGNELVTAELYGPER